MLIYMPVKIYIDPILPSVFTLSPIEVVPRIEYEFQVIARLTKIIKNSKGGLGSTIHWKKSPSPFGLFCRSAAKRKVADGFV